MDCIQSSSNHESSLDPTFRSVPNSLCVANIAKGSFTAFFHQHQQSSAGIDDTAKYSAQVLLFRSNDHCEVRAP